jgi:hypothetical protein
VANSMPSRPIRKWPARLAFNVFIDHDSTGSTRVSFAARESLAAYASSELPGTAQDSSPRRSTSGWRIQAPSTSVRTDAVARRLPLSERSPRSRGRCGTSRDGAWRASDDGRSLVRRAPGRRISPRARGEVEAGRRRIVGRAAFHTLRGSVSLGDDDGRRVADTARDAEEAEAFHRGLQAADAMAGV